MGRVKSFWGVLTANELLQLEGEYDRVVGAHKETAAQAREEFMERMDARACP